MVEVFALLVGFLVAQRLIELAVARRNRRWMLERGAVELGRRHYPALVALHGLFYIALVAERLWLETSWDRLWPLWLAILIAAQALRAWAIASLGRRWNTRILVIPGAPLVARGPYRFLRHPNYLVVALEIAVIPVLAGAYWTAFLFSIANAVMLAIRIRKEERALALS